MEYCDVNKINTFDFVPVTFCLNLADSNFENSQNHFLKFYELHLPPEMKSEKKKHWLNLPKKRFTTNVEKKISYFYCKPEIRDVYLAEDSQYLWILKPTFWNQVQLFLSRVMGSMFSTIYKNYKIFFDHTSTALLFKLMSITTRGWFEVQLSKPIQFKKIEPKPFEFATFRTPVLAHHPSSSKSTCKDLYCSKDGSLTSESGCS